jgi:1-acyl-sn-glycerol-3-phosphate acyltransferase
MAPRSLTRQPVEVTATSPATVARSTLFNLAFWLWTGVLALAGLPVLLAPRQVVQGYARVWLRGAQWLLATIGGLDYQVRGQARRPAEPAIFALKHQSAWETLVCHLLFDDPAIALKRELTLIPVFGWYLARTGMIRIDRGAGPRALRSLIEGARQALARGSSVIIFPEGTRVPVGERRPYSPGVAGLYLQLERPVVPVALNSGLFWPRRSFVKRRGRITVEFLEPIAPGLDRQAFMAELERRLEAATRRLIEEARGANSD